MVQSYVLLGTLGVHSLEDIREQKITVTVTLFSGILGVLLHLLFQNRSIYEMLLGVIPGIGVLALSCLAKRQIGIGDGMIFMLTGLYLGFWDNLLLMFLSFTLAGIWGLFLILARRCKRTDRMPFVPFLFFGYSLMILF